LGQEFFSEKTHLHLVSQIWKHSGGSSWNSWRLRKKGVKVSESENVSIPLRYGSDDKYSWLEKWSGRGSSRRIIFWMKLYGWAMGNGRLTCRMRCITFQLQFQSFLLTL
jgi:hypothetical protein